MTNSGGSWSRRQGLSFRRLCSRPGCGAPATTTLRFQPTRRQAWLTDLDETAARTQGDLCRRHAAALVLPRGWELHDVRTARSHLVDEAAAAPPTRRVRVRRRAAPPDPERAPDPLPGFEPVVVTNGNGAGAAPEPVEAAVADVVEVVAAVDVEVDAVDVDAGNVSRAVPAQFGANDGDEVDDEALSTMLDARTPLLQRAFRNSKPDA